MWLLRWAYGHFRRRVEAMDAYVAAGVADRLRDKEAGMVGGKVIETIILNDEVWVNARDNYPPRKPDECAIYVERNSDSERIAVGDSIWWQGGWAMWTPASREFADRKIPRASYSGVGRPEGHDVLDHEEIAV
jgi:hypothetical protein